MPVFQPLWLDNGVVQSCLVLAFSVVFNISRWFEFEYDVIVVERNRTGEDGRLESVNESTVIVQVETMKSCARVIASCVYCVYRRGMNS